MVLRLSPALKVACVTGHDSMFRIHLKKTPPTTYRNAFVAPEEQKKLSALLNHFFDNGLIMVETCSGLRSTPMTQSEIDHLSQVTLDGLRKIKPTF